MRDGKRHSVTRKRTILIAGPTASGKSALALKVAEAVDGVIINADSMQVYKELRVLTARPSEEDCALVPHRLYGHVGAAQRYSVGSWLEDVSKALDETWHQAKVPVIVGGTGLYFKALEEGIAEVPPVPEAVHVKWRERLQRDGALTLYHVLAQRDPVLAGRLKPTETQRVLRGLEVHDASGKSLSHWQNSAHTTPLMQGVDPLRLLVTLPRDELYARCDQRLEVMLENGAIEEVANLFSLDVDPQLPAMKALGVQHLKAYLDEQCTIEDVIDAVQTWTRRYAKRQLTWFRSNMISWTPIDTQDSERTMPELFSILRENELTP